jgi:hypothetical protein
VGSSTSSCGPPPGNGTDIHADAGGAHLQPDQVVFDAATFILR